MRRLWEGLQVQIGLEATQSKSSWRYAKLRKTSIFMRSLRERIKNRKRPRNSQSIAHRRKALYLRSVWQVFRL